MKYKSLQELFIDESKWTKDSNAKDAFGLPVWLGNSSATCFCLNGGKLLVYDNDNEKIRIQEKLNNAVRELFPERIKGSKDNYVYFNDHPDTVFADIRKVIEYADV